jgi:hypothetical protein
MMLFRSHRDNGRSIIGLAESEDGYNFTVRPEPFMIPPTEGISSTYWKFLFRQTKIRPSALSLASQNVTPVSLLCIKSTQLPVGTLSPTS